MLDRVAEGLEVAREKRVKQKEPVPPTKASMGSMRPPDGSRCRMPAKRMIMRMPDQKTVMERPKGTGMA
ncbi:hypothetical protein [Olsenella sp. HMSC062G07]|uniref:hypothetical protein n=1 Tax=Olsenella sp. HMSC062G07 TaxID=1739330 RepID=UPI0008A42A55|nr:hypothetical protein [Olsenella sp. HMSC062G07]OFK22432.1 hypothetical protein HMPREF2826_01410 [Olsenella sp. HMSC062G07]